MTNAAPSIPPSRGSNDPVSPTGVGIPPLPTSGLASWLPGLWVLRH